MACPKEKILKALATYTFGINTTNMADSTMQIGPHSIPLFTRNRTYGFTYNYDMKEQVGSCFEQPVHANEVISDIVDAWVAVDSEIIYLDPRNDHVVYRETTVQINYEVPITTYDSFVHYAFFNDLPITIVKTVKTISSILGVLEESTDTINKTVNLCVASGFGHLDANFVDEKYYSYDEAIELTDFDSPERDGWGWTYPVYLHGYSPGTKDREYTKLLDVYEFDAPPGDINVEHVALGDLTVDDFPQGSWAFDRDGNMFVSQMLQNSIFNMLRSATGIIGDPVLLTKLTGENPVFYPISPV